MKSWVEVDRFTTLTFDYEELTIVVEAEWFEYQTLESAPETLKALYSISLTSTQGHELAPNSERGCMVAFPQSWPGVGKSLLLNMSINEFRAMQKRYREQLEP